MPEQPDGPLETFLAGEGTALRLPADGAAVPVTDPGAGTYDRVGLRLADRSALTSYVAPPGVLARAVAVLVDDAPGALALAPRPEWPALRRLRSRPASGGWLTVARFAAPVDVAAVLAELGRQAVRPPAWLREPGDGPGLDQRVFNPIGFDPAADGPVATVTAARPTERLVADLRTARGAQVTPDTPREVVAALAMAGVPLVGTAPEGLDDRVAAAVAAPVDLDDAVAREEHSVVLRRAALDAHGRPVPQPAVSVVLATKRPEMIGHALRQVAKQRGVERLELVVAPHGFALDPAHAAEHAGVPVTVLPQDAATPFGDVLTAAARAAAGDVVLKMDDDDWYARDAVADLLRARAYSGADLVGMPAEYHYLAPVRTTIKRGHRAETWARFVAGGTMMVDAPLLREVGFFRSVRRYVDAQLLAAVLSAGGTVYRTHGLGYLLRRNASGHTWEIDLEELLDPANVQARWAGFRPSRLLECDPDELPDELPGELAAELPGA